MYMFSWGTYLRVHQHLARRTREKSTRRVSREGIGRGGVPAAVTESSWRPCVLAVSVVDVFSSLIVLSSLSRVDTGFDVVVIE